jgi:hypothetical protein
LLALLHADLGAQHGGDLDDLLDALPSTDQHRALMGVSAIASVRLLAQARQKLLDRF